MGVDAAVGGWLEGGWCAGERWGGWWFWVMVCLVGGRVGGVLGEL